MAYGLLSATCFIEGYSHNDHHCNHQHPKADEIRVASYLKNLQGGAN
ncbi:hypothetical protein Bhyg_10087 [Pseudolycoriella hygida]|uniref:Uncharacterized protein n=1 Tax=Pseudolycoriella hygida TaxID=35572 RepID=A0A9Q0MSV2_9DIPT|nr:hypothetical protein Bhyg_10087 [Pseudolycoriella hygida]